MAKQKTPQPVDQPDVIYHDRRPANPPSWLILQEEYSRAEFLSVSLIKSQRLSIHLETAYNLLSAMSPYKLGIDKLSEDIIQEKLKAVRLVNYLLEQLITANPLLLPDGYAIANDRNYLRVTRASHSGAMEMRDESMSPTLPKGTKVYYFSLDRSEWMNYEGVVSVSLYDNFDAVTIGRMTQRTDEGFVLKRDNPDYADLPIKWSNVVRMIMLKYLVGERIR